MKNLFEFKAFIDNDSFHFIDEMIDRFIKFIESKSIFLGGGYGDNYMQGGLYCDENLKINEENIQNEIVAYFQRLNDNIKVDINIFGIPKIGFDYLQCCCCGYFSLEEKGTAEICPVCFWEDDGENDLDMISNPNRMTLRQGRDNFVKFGACEKQFLQDVVKKSEIKYRKGNL
jgi:hypothetical protein